MSTWDSSQYLKFAGERTQPSLDLVSRITLDAITPDYPRQADGRVLMPFRRLFVIARR